MSLAPPSPCRPASYYSSRPAGVRVTFTASASREKLSVCRHSWGDVAAVIKAAVTEKLNASKPADSGRPRHREEPEETDTSVVALRPGGGEAGGLGRDGGRCTFVDGKGSVQSDEASVPHRDPFARGGDRSLASICLMPKPITHVSRSGLRQGSWTSSVVRATAFRTVADYCRAGSIPAVAREVGRHRGCRFDDPPSRSPRFPWESPPGSTMASR
jgi:hypothetical protein